MSFIVLQLSLGIRYDSAAAAGRCRGDALARIFLYGMTTNYTISCKYLFLIVFSRLVNYALESTCSSAVARWGRYIRMTMHG